MKIESSSRKKTGRKVVSPSTRKRKPSGGTVGEVARTKWLVFKHSEIHGTGAFALVPIPAATVLIEYVGQRITKAESLRRCEQNNEYIFSLNAQEDLDGNVAWNPARFINHSCAPNCEAELDEERIWIKASRDIASGEEVTFNYGYDLEEYRDYPCRCGAPGCVGYIVAEEFFEHVRRATAHTTPGKASGGQAPEP
jgi:SET domain-containing protein